MWASARLERERLVQVTHDEQGKRGELWRERGREDRAFLTESRLPTSCYGIARRYFVNARVVLGVLELDLSIPATPHARKSAQETRSGAGSRASRGVYVASSYVAVRVHSPIREEQ